MSDLKCPNCGTHVPPTGVSSAYGVGPDPPTTNWRQRSSCPNCHRLLIRNLEPPMDQWRLPPEVLSIGGTATLRASGTVTATGGVHHQVQVADDLQAADSAATAGSAVASSVHVEAGIRRDQWDMACTTFGVTTGGLMAGKGGAVIGGVAGYIYGRRKWPKDLEDAD